MGMRCIMHFDSYGSSWEPKKKKNPPLTYKINQSLLWSSMQHLITNNVNSNQSGNQSSGLPMSTTASSLSLWGSVQQWVMKKMGWYRYGTAAVDRNNSSSLFASVGLISLPGLKMSESMSSTQTLLNLVLEILHFMPFLSIYLPKNYLGSCLCFQSWFNPSIDHAQAAALNVQQCLSHFSLKRDSSQWKTQQLLHFFFTSVQKAS